MAIRGELELADGISAAMYTAVTLVKALRARTKYNPSHTITVLIAIGHILQVCYVVRSGACVSILLL